MNCFVQDYAKCPTCNKYFPNESEEFAVTDRLCEECERGRCELCNKAFPYKLANQNNLWISCLCNTIKSERVYN
jgi:hypothetical protein